MNYPILALILANIIWGAAVPIFKLSIANIPPFIFLFIRFFIAALIFAPGVIAKYQPLAKKDMKNIFFASISGFTLAIAFLFLGLQKAPSLNFSAIVAMGPLLLYLCAVILLRERPHRRTIYGGLIACAGVLFIILFPILAQGNYNAGELIGNLLFILATIFNVIYILISKKTLKKIPVNQTLFWVFAIASITFVPFAILDLQHWSMSELNTNGLVGLMYGVIFSSVLAYFFEQWAISRTDAQQIGIFTYLVPIMTVLVAIPLLHEYPTIYFYIGAIFVIIGIIIAESHISFHPHPVHKL